MPRSSAMSAAFCTKLRATQSTSKLIACRRSSRSLGVSGEIGSTIVGVLTPLRLLSLPPISTLQSTKPSPLPVTVIRSLPSSRRSVSPTCSVLMISGCGMPTRVSSPSRCTSRSKRKLCPSRSITEPSPWNCSTRCLGPCRSARMAMGWSYCSSMERIRSTRAFFSVASPWLKFRRNTSTPARKSASMTSRDEDAGPRVATCLVRFAQRPSWLFSICMCSTSSGVESACRL
mmetsp:Transcript_6201/g.24157  ORF Transcript_6201/g.24157 Transcript_6201/m.24157 type:complete len:231 (-) Transcript_6201:232-924(-)